MSIHKHNRISGVSLSWLLVGIALLAAAIAIVWQAQNSETIAEAQAGEREAAYQAANEAATEQTDSWPATPQALVEAFWLAASQKDYERMTILCPGSLAADFKTYYDKWTPSSARAVGKPEPLASQPGMQLYPVKVDFPGFPAKTIKMAITKNPAGRLIVDGKHTIWW